MGKNVGWEKMERKILDSPLWSRNEPFDDRSAYTDLRLRANFAESKFCPDGRDVITVEPRELFTSIRSLAARWHWSEGKVRRYLNFLESINLATIKKYNRGTLVKLMPVEETDNERHNNEHNNDSNSKDDDKHGRRYTDRHSGGTHNKKDKKDKEGKEDSKRNPEGASRRGIALGGRWGGDPE